MGRGKSKIKQKRANAANRPVDRHYNTVSNEEDEESYEGLYSNDLLDNSESVDIILTSRGLSVATSNSYLNAIMKFCTDTQIPPYVKKVDITDTDRVIESAVTIAKNTLGAKMKGGLQEF